MDEENLDSQEPAVSDASATSHPDAETETGVGPDEVTLLHAEVEDLQNRLLRTQADFDNFRRRSRQEREDLTQFATSGLVSELLPIVDHFALALQADTTLSEDHPMVKGVGMMYKQFLGVLEKAGLQVMETTPGDAFDPKRHEAVVSEVVEEQEAGIVLQVLRSGFVLHGKVLRPAMVKVSG